MPLISEALRWDSVVDEMIYNTEEIVGEACC